MKVDMKKVVASSAGEITAVAALVTATVVVDTVSIGLGLLQPLLLRIQNL
ncbi:MAG: hypothetical protein K6A75_08860 [Ruminococcus sp.]|jgi:hypothetical protein|nr:hypothetical protein [Ruminococcus sp.]